MSLRRLLQFSIQYPWFVIVAIGVITVGLSIFIPRVQLRLTGRSLIPLGHSTLAASDSAASQFGWRDVVVVGVANGKEGLYTSDGLDFVTSLTEQVSRVPGILATSVISLATIPGSSFNDGTFQSTPLIPRRTKLEEATVRGIRLECETLALNDGFLLASDGHAAAIYGEVEPEANRYEVLQRVREIAGEGTRSGYKIYLSGTALAQAILGNAVARDLFFLIPGVIIVLASILWVAYRHPVVAIISLTEISVSLLWTAGIIGGLGQAVFVTTLVLPVILIAIGVSDDVYAFNRYLGERRRTAKDPIRKVVVASFRSVERPILLTAGTTMAGLLSLAATQLEPLRVFGIFGALAIGFSTVLTFTLVPALLVLINPTEPRGESGKQRRLTQALIKFLRILDYAGPHRLLIACGISACLAALVIKKIRIDDSWMGNLPAKSDIVRGDKALNNLMAGTTTLELKIDSNRYDGFLEPKLFACLGVIENSLSNLPFVGSVHSIYDEVIRTGASFHDWTYSAYRDSLQHGRLDLSTFDMALLLHLSQQHILNRKLIDSTYRQTRMTVFIRSANYRRIEEVWRTALTIKLPESCESIKITPFGDGWISYQTVRLLVAGQIWSIVLALLFNLILIAVLFKSLRLAVITILPVAFSVLFVFAILSVSGIPLGIANSMFAAIALGIGVDYSIHLTADYREGLRQSMRPREAMQRAFAITGPAIVTSAIAVAAGFAVLMLSAILPNMLLGLLVCLSLIVCAVMTLILVPGLTRVMRF